MTPTSPLCILVVDDQAMARQVVCDVLRGRGHEVLQASDGIEGWEVFQREAPQLVVSDIKMPGLDGVQLLERVREHSPRTEVVLITGFADTDLVIRALRKGASNFIEKPFRPAEFLRHLEPSFLRCSLAAESARLQKELEVERQRRETQERLATMGRLLAGLAHEVHNPLTFLKGNVELVRMLLHRLHEQEPRADRDGTISEVCALLDDVAFGAQRIEDLVQTLRRFGSPARSSRRMIPLARVMESSHKLALPRRPKNVEIRVRAPPRELLVEVDEVEIESCFVNLLVNAYEALESAGGHVSFSAAVVPYATGVYSGLVEVAVEDDGEGVPQGIVDEVFTPFFTRKQGGTGLGLSLAYEAAKRNSAQLEIHSEEGKGTRVVLRVPYTEAAEGATTGELRAPPAVPPPVRGGG